MLEAPSPISPGQTGNAGLTLPAKAPYARVKEFLKQGLASGHWQPGALMPSDSELVTQFGVSRMTVTRALRELQNRLAERLQQAPAAASGTAPFDTLHFRPIGPAIQRHCAAAAPSKSMSAGAARRGWWWMTCQLRCSRSRFPVRA